MATNAEDSAELNNGPNGFELASKGVDLLNTGNSNQTQANQKKDENNEEIYRYPLKAIHEKTDHLLIKIFQKQSKENTFGLNKIVELGEIQQTEKKGNVTTVKTVTGVTGFKALTSTTDFFNTEESKKQLEKNIKYIFLPIPQQISDSLSVAYAEDRLDPLQAGGLALGAELINNPVKAVAEGMQVGGAVLNGVTGIDQRTIGALKAALSGKLVNSLGANVSPQSIVTRATGQILQSNLELLFSDVTLRTFPFTYDFAPRDPQEAEMVKQIIRTLKKSMVPKNGKDALFINSPDIFQLEYKTGNKEHRFLNKFKVCALSDLSVNYTASGTYATYADGTPVHIQVSMTFKELNPIYAEDYDEEPIGVGF